ncbi:hypothetical protein [uncultured Thiothrix sp.]|uniref:hypothetical protein n=1 Tax=uncultured Thiothrix sp. TaxID=223185 RepID=UPI0026318766|nr:hypothetical protein [uncultured Thiothrix sp.]
MTNTIIVDFGTEREYSFIVHPEDIQNLSKDEAQDWLAQEFEDLECSPSSPVGKILLVDMLLNVAKYAGEERFKERTEWAQQFVKAVATLLKRSTVRIDVDEFAVA